MDALPAHIIPRLVERLDELMELAQIAPLVEVGDFAPERAPPLHLTVDDYVFTYRLSLRDRLLRVSGVSRL